MIPVQVSAPPTTRRPVVTIGLVAVLVVAFVHALRLDQVPPVPYCTDLTESARALRASASTLQGFVCRWGAIPDDLHEGRGLYTLVTSVFVHTSWLHLVFNLAFLGAFAPRVEEDLGHLGLLGVFLGSAVLGGAAHVLLVPNLTVPSIGASGGVAGVLGAHLLLAPRAQVRVLVGPVPVRLPTWFIIVLWAGPQLFLTGVILRRAEYPGGVSYEVHTAGFLLGLLVAGAVLLVRPDLRRWRLPRAERPGSLALLAAPDLRLGERGAVDPSCHPVCRSAVSLGLSPPRAARMPIRRLRSLTRARVDRWRERAGPDEVDRPHARLPSRSASPRGLR